MLGMTNTPGQLPGGISFNCISKIGTLNATQLKSTGSTSVCGLCLGLQIQGPLFRPDCVCVLLTAGFW